VASLTLIPGTGGVFGVTADGRSVWSKKANGKFPDPDALVADVKKLLGGKP
jgi:selenoprotein W-related protein